MMTEVKKGRIGEFAVIEHVCDSRVGRMRDLMKQVKTPKERGPHRKEIISTNLAEQTSCAGPLQMKNLSPALAVLFRCLTD